MNGNLDVTLQGGSGGAGGSGTGGGGGGGAIALFGKVVTITSTGRVNANGGGGAVGGTGASGGGSGGGIFVHGNVIENRGQLNAKGGDGGAGGGFGDAGGGGGGRVATRFTSLRAAGTTTVTGGTSGARTTGGCCGHGGLSPDATGATGVTTQTVGTQVINFDDAVAPDPNPAPCSFINTNALTERYAGRGVHFSGPAAGSGGAILNQCGSFGVNGHSSPNFLAFNTGVNYANGKPASGPETIRFDKPISSATINTGQGSGGTATLTALKGTQVVGSAFRTSTSALSPLTVSGEHITSLRLSFTGSAIVFDDLRWNTEPVSGGESFSTAHNTPLKDGGLRLLANDSDRDGDPLTAALERGPAHGSVSVRPDGGFTYTPASGFSGADSFAYRAGDGDGSGNEGTVTINVAARPRRLPRRLRRRRRRRSSPRR